MNYYMGLDVSKGYADIIVIDEQRKVIEQNFQLDDTAAGQQQLFNFIKCFFEKHPDAKLYAAVESTGGYENNWLYALQKLEAQYNLFSARLNPKGVHYHSKAGLNRVVTDKISAQTIADYLISHPQKVNYNQRDNFATHRSQWNFIQMLIKQKVQLSNQLEKITYRAHPELLAYWRKNLPSWALQLMQLYPTSQKLSKADVEQLALIPYISATKAQQLIARAKTSVASAQDTVIENLIVSLVTEILHKQKLIAQQTKQLISQCRLPEIKLLTSIPGIGTFSAIGLLLEIGSIERFRTVKQLAAFCGLHPKFKQSGDGTWDMRMSKEGRSQPRSILFMVSLVAIQHNSIIREVFFKNLDKGKCRLDAIGVCMHKMLRLIYGILKTKRDFDPAIDWKNQTKHVGKRKVSSSSSLRRYQALDPDAPISFVRNRKRTKQQSSQDDQRSQQEIEVSAPCLTDA